MLSVVCVCVCVCVCVLVFVCFLIDGVKALAMKPLLKFADCVPVSSIVYHSRSPKDFVKMAKMEEEKNEIDYESKSNINEKEEIRELKTMSYLLHDKYIRASSEYEINLSRKIRNRFCRRYFLSFAYWMSECKEFNTLSKMFHLFDDIESELIVLLYFSWQRFKESNYFGKVEPLLFNQSGDWELLL